MLIKQKRIRNLVKLGEIEKGTRIRVGIGDLKEHKNRLKEIGFMKLEIGETVLPTPVGPVSLRNAEGEFKVRKDEEKEPYTHVMYGRRSQFALGGGREIVESEFYQTRKRYPRTFIQPQEIELTIVNNSEEKVLISPVMEFEENSKKIIHTVNLFLELFGECLVLEENLENIKIPKLIRVPWNILPVGECPWERIGLELEKFAEGAKGSKQKIVKSRLEKIKKYKPDIYAVGNAGFGKYIICGFEEKGIYVLESIYTNNATYILDRDWEEISKLTKAQIIKGSLHRERIIHSKEWEKKIDELLA